ncbi:hypothetical protein [Noviherbaspirillum pedocola]|uniref:Uncharacterized protein n=1 Tax=Noviherbaspirillum pedocola TaxID=2801341 RepID=A0A934SUG8_9BURK|nr:hypothetical protein [Noviherbaspirillum pedocola]MBK4735483.1 hypothetical protein [Noviherbaspirillum pedocola]
MLTSERKQELDERRKRWGRDNPIRLYSQKDLQCRYHSVAEHRQTIARLRDLAVFLAYLGALYHAHGASLYGNDLPKFVAGTFIRFWPLKDIPLSSTKAECAPTVDHDVPLSFFRDMFMQERLSACEWLYLLVSFYKAVTIAKFEDGFLSERRDGVSYKQNRPTSAYQKRGIVLSTQSVQGYEQFQCLAEKYLDECANANYTCPRCLLAIRK